MKAILQYRAGPRLRQQLREVAPPWLEIQVVDEADKATFQRLLSDCEVLLHVLEPVTAAVIEAAPKLRLVQKIGVGVNTIDLDAARARGVAVANMPGTNSQAVAELTLGLILAAVRRIVLLDAETKSGNGWRLRVDELDSVTEICGRTVGFVGLGEVPRRVAPAITALGGHVVYTGRSRSADASYPYLSRQQLLAEADVVSLHVPLNSETRHMIDAQALGSMKRTAVLVNTARGGLVDEVALASALRSGRLAAAAVDVLEHEPSGATNPLFELRNFLVTPHIAWLTPQTLERSLHVAIQNCCNLAHGAPLVHRVV